MRKKTKIALLLVLIMICSVVMPYSVLGQSDPIVHRLSKDNYLGKLIVEIWNTNTSEIKRELIITSENGGIVDYQIKYNADSQYLINIINPKLGELYTVNFTERFNVPTNYKDNVFQWIISNQSSISWRTFPSVPTVGGDFKLAVMLSDSTTNQPLTGVVPESVSIKAYDINNNSESSGTLLMKKVDANTYPPFVIITANYNKSDTIDIEVTVDGVVLNQRILLAVLPNEDVAENNNYPQWWISGNSPSYSIPEKTSLEISWRPAYDLNGITQYRVKANDRIVATITDDVYSEFSVTGVVYKYTLKDLDLETKYEISVEAGNSLGLWSRDSQSINYTTPSEDKKISEISQIKNILGRFWVTVYGITKEEMQDGLKVYYEEDGKRNYVSYKINSIPFTFGQTINGQSELELDDAQVQKQYQIEILPPLKLKEGNNDKLIWNLSAEKSKVFQEVSPLQPNINQNFSFVVFLDDGGEGHSQINVKKDNFKITPLKQGTNERAEGQLILKKVAVGDNLDKDGSTTAEELATYYVTASYSMEDNIDIQIAIDNITLEERLNNLKIKYVDVTPPSMPIVNNIYPTSSIVSGTAEAGSTITVKAGSTVLGTAIATSNGSFSVTITTQLVNTVLSITATDVAGNESIGTSVTVTTAPGGGGFGGGFIFNPPPVELPTKEEPVSNNIFTKNVDITKLINDLKEQILNHKNSPAVVFTDTTTHWANQNVKKFVGLGVISGYEDGSFHPDDKVTRAEFATIIAKLFAMESSNNALGIPDIKGHWANEAIQALASRGIINGYEDGSFKPDSTITRAEIIAIIARVIDLSTVQKTSNASFEDVGGSWNSKEIKEAAEAGLIEGRNTSTFAPDESSTRAESLTIILRALELNPEIKTILDQLQ